MELGIYYTGLDFLIDPRGQTCFGMGFFPWCACVGVRVFKESGNLIIKVESLIKKQIAFLCACHVGHMHIMHWRAWSFIGLLD